MTRAINLKHQQSKPKKQFREFIFIGNTFDNSVSNPTEQLNLSPNSEFVSHASVEDSLLITQIDTAENVSHQLKDLNIKPGAIVKLVSKTGKGSVILGLGNRLIGISAEIARQIVATPVG